MDIQKCLTIPCLFRVNVQTSAECESSKRFPGEQWRLLFIVITKSLHISSVFSWRYCEELIQQPHNKYSEKHIVGLQN